MPTLLTVIGTRPQFIKYAALAGSGPRPYDEIVVDTGQHFDVHLSAIFLREYQLSHPHITFPPMEAVGIPRLASLLSQLDAVCEQHRPDALLCLGDTDSTLAAGLTAVKNNVPLIHIEAGERSRDRDGTRIPPASAAEESNRVTVDHLSSLLLCATERATENLRQEASTGHVTFTGDIMYDLFLRASQALPPAGDCPTLPDIPDGDYGVCTVHRAINTDDTNRLRALLDTLNSLDFPVFLPMHPRTRLRMEEANIEIPDGSLRFLPPLGHRDILVLLRGATWVFTDSGGLTREAYFSGVPSLCLDDSTAWYDLTAAGWCTITGADSTRIREALHRRPAVQPDYSQFGTGDAAQRSVEAISRFLG